MEIVIKILNKRERSMSWLARQIGIKPPNMTYWKKGQRPIPSYRKNQMANILDYPVDILFPNG